MTGHTSTLRTALGFIRAFLARRTPFFSESARLDGIYNYLQIENVYATSGQPSEAQFSLIREAGYSKVINLAPQSILENSLIDEHQVLSDLGIEYVHIPVDFKNPTDEDFERFVREVGSVQSQKLWVHCAANMRVSAFTYRYRRRVLSEDAKLAMTDLHKIWLPVGVWQEFIHK